MTTDKTAIENANGQASDFHSEGVGKRLFVQISSVMVYFRHFFGFFMFHPRKF